MIHFNNIYDTFLAVSYNYYIKLNILKSKNNQINLIDSKNI